MTSQKKNKVDMSSGKVKKNVAKWKKTTATA